MNGRLMPTLTSSPVTLVCIAAGQAGADVAQAALARGVEVVEADDLDHFRAILPRFSGRGVSEFAFLFGLGDQALEQIAARLRTAPARVITVYAESPVDPEAVLGDLGIENIETAPEHGEAGSAPEEPTESAESVEGPAPEPVEPDPVWGLLDETVSETAEAAEPPPDATPPDQPSGEPPAEPSASAQPFWDPEPADLLIAGDPSIDEPGAVTSEAPPAPAADYPQLSGGEPPVPQEYDGWWEGASPNGSAPTGGDQDAATEVAPFSPGADEPVDLAPDAELVSIPEPEAVSEVHLVPEEAGPNLVEIGPNLFTPLAGDSGIDGTGRRGKMIVFAGPKGGIGKSTLAIYAAETLGRALSESGRKVCLLDANVGQADGAAFLERYIPKVGYRTIASLARNPQLPSIGLITTKIPSLHFDALFGPRSGAEIASGAIRPSTYITAANALLSTYDYVIVDTQVAELIDEMFAFFLLPHLDELVCVVPPIPQSVDRARLWLMSISDPAYTKGGVVSTSKIGVLLNGFDERGSYGVDDVRPIMDHWSILGVIPWSKAVVKATIDRDVLAGLASVEAPLRQALGHVVEEPGLPRDASSKGGRHRLFRSGG